MAETFIEVGDGGTSLFRYNRIKIIICAKNLMEILQLVEIFG